MDANYSMNQAPPIIGLTGGIGSGKSAVASIFQEHGCVVANADENAKAVLLDSEVRDTLVEWWGEKILNIDGHIDRAIIADIVFEDKESLHRLEKLTHPRALQMQEAQFESAPQGTRGLVIDAPLLLETGLDSLCQIIVYIDASREIRLNRVQKTRGWTVEELERREAAQLPLDMKRNKADYVLINEGELDKVHCQVKQLLEDIN
jgi:dephospho-CoA kinase